MLAVIEHDQRLLFLKVFFQDFQWSLALLFLNANGREDGLGNQIGVGQRRKLHKPHAVIELFE